MKNPFQQEQQEIAQLHTQANHLQLILVQVASNKANLQSTQLQIQQLKSSLSEMELESVSWEQYETELYKMEQQNLKLNKQLEDRRAKLALIKQSSQKQTVFKLKQEIDFQHHSYEQLTLYSNSLTAAILSLDSDLISISFGKDSNLKETVQRLLDRKSYLQAQNKRLKQIHTQEKGSFSNFERQLKNLNQIALNISEKQSQDSVNISLKDQLKSLEQELHALLKNRPQAIQQIDRVEIEADRIKFQMIQARHRIKEGQQILSELSDSLKIAEQRLMMVQKAEQSEIRLLQFYR